MDSGTPAPLRQGIPRPATQMRPELARAQVSLSGPFSRLLE